MQNKKPMAIKQEMDEVFTPFEIPKSTIEFWVQKFKAGETSIFDAERCGRSRIEGLSEKVRDELHNNQYLSARELAAMLGVDKNTVIKILREDLQMTKVNFRWIPKELSDELKAKRVIIATKMLETIQNSKKWGNVYTGDETWVYLKNPRKSMWLQSGIKPPTSVKHTIGSKKVMITVIWSPSGMKLIAMLSDGDRFTKKFSLVRYSVI